MTGGRHFAQHCIPGEEFYHSEICVITPCSRVQCCRTFTLWQPQLCLCWSHCKGISLFSSASSTSRPVISWLDAEHSSLHSDPTQISIQCSMTCPALSSCFRGTSDPFWNMAVHGHIGTWSEHEAFLLFGTIPTSRERRLSSTQSGLQRGADPKDGSRFNTTSHLVLRTAGSKRQRP